MTISNHITLADIHRMPVGQIAALPADQLALLKGAADEQLTQAKSVADWLDGAISLKYADRAQDTRQEAGKDTGTIRFEDDGVTVIAELPKRIDWDQALLAQIAENIASAGEDPAEFIETKLSVSERKYGAFPESWRKGFEPARTVRTGKPKFRLVLNEEVR
ncbi:hypothetical protein [Tropicibacter naphthalenivorans]|uniref:Uncharacterized protein n=1 Tax=Tropicibacter naphthalenivorans TaxID=441103 RepID=A0A0N7M0W5_9RHOB|nr:hypothetical protein [Tropicibacter naphthalenivorans]CUH81601.1 hypothetical protein TRN7648_03554 [Tropicibacter naphthalenivorans]SMC99623.1 hypothetical protein SAMN04488093_10937 [Tropicibacter naphthalenivorans]